MSGTTTPVPTAPLAPAPVPTPPAPAAAAPTSTPPPAKPQGDPDAPLGEPGKKALDAERDARQAAEKAAAALQKQLDDINAANMSELEKAQKAAADATSAAEKAQAEALRYRVAAKHSISDEDAELFLTGTDEDTLRRQAERLVARTPAPSVPAPPPTGAHVPGEGTSAPGAPGQLSRADVERMAAEGKHEEIEKARVEGRLADLLAGKT